jgi:hypothetical protein
MAMMVSVMNRILIALVVWGFRYCIHPKSETVHGNPDFFSFFSNIQENATLLSSSQSGIL